MLGATAVSRDLFYLSNGAHGFYLRPGLPACAVDADAQRTLTGEILCRYARGGSGPHLAQLIGLYKGQQVAVLSAVEQHQEARLRGKGGIRLDAERAQLYARALPGGDVP